MKTNPQKITTKPDKSPKVERLTENYLINQSTNKDTRSRMSQTLSTVFPASWQTNKNDIIRFLNIVVKRIITFKPRAILQLWNYGARE